MSLIIALLLSWVLTPIILEVIAVKGLKVKGVPAWAISVITCFVVGLVVLFLTEPFAKTPFNMLAMTAIVYFGQNSFYNMVVKPLRGRVTGGA